MSLSLLAALGVAFAGGVASGLAGFGFALICAPALLFFYPPQTVVATSILLTLLTGWVVLPGVWRETQLRLVAGLVPWAIAGSGLGVALLRVLNADQIGLVASIVVIVFAVTLLRDWSPPGADSAVATGVAGTASGALNAMTGIAGPPVILLFLARHFETHAFRTSIIVYFIVVDLAALAALVLAREVGGAEVGTALGLLPAALVGTIVGRSLVSRVPLANFRRLVLVMVMATGLAGVVHALSGLLASPMR